MFITISSAVLLILALNSVDNLLDSLQKKKKLSNPLRYFMYAVNLVHTVGTDKIEVTTHQGKKMIMNITLMKFIDGSTKFHSGAKIQDAFPRLSASEREFLLTGIDDHKWNQLFPPDDEEDFKEDHPRF
jgi:hypothetical protein